MHSNLQSIGEVARLVGIPRWKLAYFIETGVLPEPAVKITGRRLFSPREIERMRELLSSRERRPGASTETPPDQSSVISDSPSTPQE